MVATVDGGSTQGRTSERTGRLGARDSRPPSRPSPCCISLAACVFAVYSLMCRGAEAHRPGAAVHRFRRLLCRLRRTGRSPVAGTAPGGHPVRRGRPELRDCRQHDGQERRGHDRHGHRGRPPPVPGDRAGPPAARSLYAHPPPYRRGGRRWCADAGRPTRFKPSSPSPTDAVRDGSAKLGHPVQNVTREHGLTPLPR